MGLGLMGGFGFFCSELLEFDCVCFFGLGVIGGGVGFVFFLGDVVE